MDRHGRPAAAGRHCAFRRCSGSACASRAARTHDQSPGPGARISAARGLWRPDAARGSTHRSGGRASAATLSQRNHSAGADAKLRPESVSQRTACLRSNVANARTSALSRMVCRPAPRSGALRDGACPTPEGLRDSGSGHPDPASRDRAPRLARPQSHGLAGHDRTGDSRFPGCRRWPTDLRSGQPSKRCLYFMGR